MYRIDKRIIFLPVIFLTIILTSFSKSRNVKEIKTEYPLLADEIDYDIDKLIEGLDEKDKELYNYAQEIIKKEHAFLNAKDEVLYEGLSSRIKLIKSSVL